MALLVAPDVFSQFGVVDKGIAVALNAIDALVALDLLLAHRIHACPLHQHVDCPSRESLVAIGPIVKLRAARPGGQFKFVAGRHIEIGACQVSLVLVIGLKHRAAIARISAGSQFPLGNIGAIGKTSAGITHPIRVIGALAVDLDVGGVDMENVGIHGGNLTTKPAAWKTVLTVITLTHVGRR